MLKKYFKNKKNWKLFIILQIAGFIAIFVTYTISSSWSTLFGNSWSPLELTTGHYWGIKRSFTFAQNWIFIFCLFLPFVIAKAIDWIEDD